MRSRLTIRPRATSLEVAHGTPLQDVLFAHGVEFPCGGSLLCGRCRVRVIDGALPVTPDMRTVLTDEEIDEGWRLACRAVMQGPLTIEVAQWEASILGDDAALAFEPAEGVGIAVDVGTTTLVVQAVDLATGEVLAVASGLNPQAAHGADVMSRIQFALTADEGAGKLERVVRDAVGAMIGRAIVEGGRDRSEVREVLLAGNTVMHHLFCGYPVQPLAAVPFETPHLGTWSVSAEELEWRLPAETRVEFLACLGGFVGSDLLTGIVACGLDTTDQPVALIDLGTNGEVVLANAGHILCASTAAGPAFEGAGIKMGMRAGTGAISHVAAERGNFACTVIGCGPATGICGSGLVDAIAAGLELGRIGADGKLAGEARELSLTGGVTLSRGDIRALQLAKAAIASGLQLLAEHDGLTLDDITELHLAGAFGNYVDVTSAHRIGLIEIPPARVRPAGNTALRGTRALLLQPSRRSAIIDRILTRTRHVPLVSEPAFQDRFVDSLAFPG